MGTNNFHTESGEIFALRPDLYEEDFADVKEYVFDALKEKFGKAFSETSLKDTTELRSFPSEVLGLLEGANNTGLLVIIRSGYYEGANVDYTRILRDEYGNAFTPYSDADIRLSELRSLLSLEKKLNKVLSKFTEPLKVAARFSNGETLYESK